ncbi:MAG TPA: hypothetical protein VGF24_30350 [Vicinamibacterales bacterium]|jgi:hypothetical protein
MQVRKIFACAGVFVTFALSSAYAQQVTTRQIALAGRTSALRAADGGLSPVTQPTSTSNSALDLSFDGITDREQRLANGGQTISTEPAQPGLCVANGFVLETTSGGLRVFDTAGNPLAPVVDLNTFFGYPPAFSNAGELGPSLNDVSCHFDADTQRMFVLTLTLERVGTTSELSRVNHLDLAVSQTSDPFGGWNIYKIPGQNDGTQGTPDHHCAHGPCLADFPHIGADANGIYITTNEFSFEPGFANSILHGAQIYAISKRALTSGAPALTVTELDTADPDLLLDGKPGFTVVPATSPPDNDAGELGGTEYFLSSVAVTKLLRTSEDEPSNERTRASDNRLRVWALSNTQSLDSDSPALVLHHGLVEVEPYDVPNWYKQKRGDTPLRDCLNDSALMTPTGNGCWRILFAEKPRHSTTELILASDSRMQQVVFADGKLWSAFNTSQPSGGDQADVAYFVIQPRVSSGGVGAEVVSEGYVGLPGNSLIHPAVGVTANGKAVIAFTVFGADHFPSAGFATLDTTSGAGAVEIAAEGLGPEDGFLGYQAFGGSGVARFGDGSAAVPDGDSIWIASEYIGQTCTFEQFVADRGACGGTRIASGNWYTRISRVTPK